MRSQARCAALTESLDLLENVSTVLDCFGIDTDSSPPLGLAEPVARRELMLENADAGLRDARAGSLAFGDAVA